MISVIVPVYHVEEYLDQCVQSLLNQTYKDLEIILVDDGSADLCSSMCDAFAKNDSRVKVIHKENGGLSDARNVGLDAATGDYIAFVDSDDYVHSEMFEVMLPFLERNPDIDIAMCRYTKVEEDDNSMHLEHAAKDFYMLDHDNLIKDMFSDQYEMFVVVWNKLYRRKVWEQLRFPLGKLREDEFVSYKYLYEQQRVGVFYDKFYHYRQRKGSIMQQCEIKAYWDNTEAIKEKVEFFSTKKSTEYSLCVKRSLETLIYYYSCAVKCGENEKATFIRNCFLDIWKKAKKDTRVSIEKERRVYFNSFEKSYGWMESFMPLYWKRVSLTRKVKNKVLSKYYLKKGKRQAGTSMNPTICSIEETLEKIAKEKCSVSRFGDGEYKWMAGIPQTSFQRFSEEMQQRLIEISKSDEPNHLVCLSDGFGKLDYLNANARYFWYGFMGEHRARWISFLKPGKVYYNTNMTRPYMDYADKTPCAHRFELLKEIWKDRDIILIEGDKSRLGIGNDLFSTAKSVKRILAPARDAFGKYDAIMEAACRQDKDALYLIALGPTATILSFDLYKTGRQAIDVGHVDIEYEWFLMGATEKVTIDNKFVNEVDAGLNCTDMVDEEYQSQIIERVQW
ncbi:MAG: SP_1767 family glycosyltransferase [Lachnospiraceae bacterium]|nr:SP_1767 family glycosyltransferase [Lachnospiraceae bacterium]